MRAELFLGLLNLATRIVVEEHGLASEQDVDDSHVDEVYAILWSTPSLKLATEMRIDAGTVRKYLWENASRRSHGIRRFPEKKQCDRHFSEGGMA